MPRSWLWTHSLAGALALATPALLAAQALPAAKADSAEALARQFEASLRYKSGKITLKDDLATLDVPASWRYLDPADSKRLLEDAWGNPKGSSEDVLGMLLPAGSGRSATVLGRW